jgi:hypothetical protein
MCFYCMLELSIVSTVFTNIYWQVAANTHIAWCWILEIWIYSSADSDPPSPPPATPIHQRMYCVLKKENYQCRLSSLCPKLTGGWQSWVGMSRYTFLRKWLFAILRRKKFNLEVTEILHCKIPHVRKKILLIGILFLNSHSKRQYITHRILRTPSDEWLI